MASVGSILGGGFRLIRDRPVAIAIWAVTYFVVALILGLAMAVLMTGRLALGTNPLLEPFLWTPATIAGFVLIQLSALLLAVVLINAAFRLVLRPEEPAFFGMRLGMDEVRIAALIVLLAIASFIAMLIGQLLLIFLTAFVAFVCGESSAGAWLMLACFLGFFCAGIWVCVRLSLILPVSYYRRRMTVDGAWELTRSRFWTLFGTYLTLLLLLAAIGFGFAYVLMGDYFAAVYTAHGDQELMARAAFDYAARQEAMPLLSRIGVMVASTVIFAVGLAIGPGTLASATRALLAEAREPTDMEAEAGHIASETE